MKNPFLFLVLILILGFFNCNGRQTKKEALEHAISQFNLKNPVLQKVNYHPETYVEIVTDTIIPNNVNIHIKNYTLLDEQILLSNSTNSASKEINYQRVFESEVIVSIASKAIFSTHISAKQFKKSAIDPFWDNATLQHVWVNQDLSTTTAIKLDISFMNPQNNNYKLYRMSIDPYGQQSLNLIEERS